MVDRDRVLRPLDEAGPSIDQLQEYESPVALEEALRATWHAVDSTLRGLLRSDARVPDSFRLSAQSRQALSTDAVVTELRRHDIIALTLAGEIHELSRALERWGRSDVRAADADQALHVVSELRQAVLRLGASEREPTPEAVATPHHIDPPDPAAQEADAPAARGGESRPLRRPVVVVAVVAVLLVLATALVLIVGRSSDLGDGIAAFRDGRAGVAEQHFRAALQRDQDNVTARLYLARILREQGRHQEAADLLRAAAALAPRDAAVRRELGYLFLTLNRPQQAAAQFRQSVELEPQEPLGWVGLVHALRRFDPSSADLTLSRAPAAAQAMIRSGRQ
jgi:tetratricopeptide (TPR) repeat protein